MDKAALDSGLLLDLLAQHTTPLGTAGQRTKDSLCSDYSHLGKRLAPLIQSCTDSYLLNTSNDDTVATRLAHDTLAPLVRLRFDESDLPGQRARRILDHRAMDWVDGKEGAPLDSADLKVVEAGRQGTRQLNAVEQKMLNASQQEGARKERRTRRKNGALKALDAGILISLAATSFLWKRANDNFEEARSALDTARVAKTAADKSAKEASDNLVVAERAQEAAEKSEKRAKLGLANSQRQQAIVLRDVKHDWIGAGHFFASAANKFQDVGNTEQARNMLYAAGWTVMGAHQKAVYDGGQSGIIDAMYADGILIALVDKTVMIWQVDDEFAVQQSSNVEPNIDWPAIEDVSRKIFLPKTDRVIVANQPQPGSAYKLRLTGHGGFIIGYSLSELQKADSNATAIDPPMILGGGNADAFVGLATIDVDKSDLRRSKAVLAASLPSAGQIKLLAPINRIRGARFDSSGNWCTVWGTGKSGPGVNILNLGDAAGNRAENLDAKDVGFVVAKSLGVGLAIWEQTKAKPNANRPVLTADQNRVYIVDAKTGETDSRLFPDGIDRFVPSGTGRKLARLRRDAEIWWQAYQFKGPPSQTHAAPPHLHEVIFLGPDEIPAFLGSTIAHIGSELRRKNRGDAWGQNPEWFPINHPFNIDGIDYRQFSWGGLVLTWDFDQVRVWDVKTGMLACQPLRHGGAIKGASFIGNSDQTANIMTWSEDGSLRIWEINGSLSPSVEEAIVQSDRQLLESATWQKPHIEPAAVSAIHKESHSLGGMGDHGATVADRQMHSEDGKFTAEWKAGKRTFDVFADNAEAIAVHMTHDPGYAVEGVRFDPTSASILSFAKDHLYVWDVVSEARIIPTLINPGKIANAAFKEDGTILVRCLIGEERTEKFVAWRLPSYVADEDAVKSIEDRTASRLMPTGEIAYPKEWPQKNRN